MEASSARDRETKVAPKPTRMHPYTIEAGPPFNKANWKVRAKASQETSMMSPKLMIEERLIYLYGCLSADTVRLVISAKCTSSVCELPGSFVVGAAKAALISTSSRLTSAPLRCSVFVSAILSDDTENARRENKLGVAKEDLLGKWYYNCPVMSPWMRYALES
jgi:hypothetical protein